MRATRRAYTVVLALVLSIVTAGGACSDGAETDPDAACQKFAGATCDRLDSCSPTYLAMLWGDASSCTSRVKTSCLKAQQATGTQLTPARLSDCADGMAARPCEQLQDPEPPAACKPTPGTLTDGTACAEDHQCVGAYCKKPRGACGVCSKRVAAGEACASGDDCDFGLACRNKACVKYVTLGDTCDSGKPCRPPAVCVKGVCAKRRGQGRPCDAMAQDCDEVGGLYCSPITNVCEKTQVAKAGEPCGPHSGGYTLCAASGRCKAGVGGAQGTCLAAAKDGESCDLIQGPNCLPSASCEGGVCKLSDPSVCK